MVTVVPPTWCPQNVQAEWTNWMTGWNSIMNFLLVYFLLPYWTTVEMFHLVFAYVCISFSARRQAPTRQNYLNFTEFPHGIKCCRCEMIQLNYNKLHHTPIRLAQITTSWQSQVLARMQWLELPCIAGGMKNGTATWENILPVSYKVRHPLIIQPRNSILRYLPKKKKTYTNTTLLYLNHVIAALFKIINT